MREIKFRQWDDLNKRMKVTGMGINQGVLTADSTDVMQFTGLRDKHGRDIYEGDIIRFRDRGNMFDFDVLDCTAKVVMQYASWFAEPIYVPGLRDFRFRGYDFENEPCEVIGNVFENPELIAKDPPQVKGQNGQRKGAGD